MGTIANRYEFVIFSMWRTETPTVTRMPVICLESTRKPATAW